MRKAFALLIVFSLMLLFGCKEESVSEQPFSREYLEEVLEPISEEDQVGIENAYREKYGLDIQWCLPMDVDRFGTFDDLERYVSSNCGWRCYAKFGGSYLLTLFWGKIGVAYPAVFSELNLGGVSEQNTLLTNGTCWEVAWAEMAIVYDSGELIEVPNVGGGIWDLSRVLPVLSYAEASIIPARHKAYNDRYFGKFMIEGEKYPDQALFRILDEVDPDETLRWQ